MADERLLDEIRDGFGLKNDSELATFLGLTRTTIHNVRFKGAKLGLKSRMLVLDRIGFLRVANWTQRIAPASLAGAIHAGNEHLTQQNIAGPPPADAAQVAEVDLIEVIKQTFGFENDVDLANFLGVARNTISMVRSGKSALGPKPRLRILNRIAPFAIEDVERALENTDELIEVIRDWRRNNAPQEGAAHQANTI